MSAYVPAGQDTFDILINLIPRVQEFLKHSLQNPMIQLRMKTQGESDPETLSSFPFSGRIYIYYDGILGSEQLGDLKRAYNVSGLAPEFRGNDYLLATWLNITAGVAQAPPEFGIEDDAICLRQNHANGGTPLRTTPFGGKSCSGQAKGR